MADEAKETLNLLQDLWF